jgi:hypothetical protein
MVNPGAISGGRSTGSGVGERIQRTEAPSPNDSDAYTKDTDPQVVKLLEPCFCGTPDARIYEVSNSTSHKVAAA